MYKSIFIIFLLFSQKVFSECIFSKIYNDNGNTFLTAKDNKVIANKNPESLWVFIQGNNGDICYPTKYIYYMIQEAKCKDIKSSTCVYEGSSNGKCITMLNNLDIVLEKCNPGRTDQLWTRFNGGTGFERFHGDRYCIKGRCWGYNGMNNNIIIKNSTKGKDLDQRFLLDH